MRPDGSVLCEPGFDSATGLYLHWRGEPLSISERPTIDDARRAVAVLIDLIADFPLAGDMYRGAWLAALYSIGPPDVRWSCAAILV